MAVACRPADFDCGIEAPDGSAWQVFDEEYTTNPKFLLTDADYDMLILWRQYQGGMGVGHLPEAGGMLDQPAIMIDAFAFMGSAERELKK